MNNGVSGVSIDQKLLSEMQYKLDRAFDINSRRVSDMMRLRDHLQHLKSDFEVLKANKKLQKFDEKPLDPLEASTDSDRMVND
jgi:hypothetical protein